METPNKPTTLVTFLGGSRGKDPEKPVYQEATYIHGDQKEQDRVFLPALLRMNLYNIQRVVVLGTTTSLWECLVPDTDSLHLDLWNDVRFESGVSKDLLKRLEEFLSDKYKVEIETYASPTEINAGNAFTEMAGYAELLKRTPEDHEILVDFTHGFRSLPMLLLSALQYQSALSHQVTGPKVRLVYAEFRGAENESPVHRLDSIWESMEIAEAARLFFDRFDGELLAEVLQPVWPKLAKALRRLSGILMANYASRLEEVLRQFGKVLGNPPANPPAWLPELTDRMQSFHKELSHKNSHETLFKLSGMYQQRRLWALAVITLYQCLEAGFCEREGTNFEEYEATKDIVQDYLDDLPRSDLRYKNLCKLRGARNAVAHGGSRSKKGGLPDSSNLPNQMKTYSRAVAEALNLKY